MIIVKFKNKNTGRIYNKTLAEFERLRQNKFMKGVFIELSRVKEPPEVAILREKLKGNN